MKTWVIITLVSIVLASVGTAVALVIIYLKKRSKFVASSAYNQSVVDQGVVTQALATQTQIVENAVDIVGQTLDDAQGIQDGAFSEFSQTNRELQDLQQNLAEASTASEALQALQTAEDTSVKADKALQGAQQDLSFYNKTRDTIATNTSNAIQTITQDLKKQAAALASFKKDLQEKTVQQANLVNNPSVTQPTLDNKPSIRTVWDAAIQFLIMSPPPDVALKQLAEIYDITTQDANELAKAAKEYVQPSKCEAITRISVGGQWVCPDGWTDTGRNWGDVDGATQCTRGPCPPLSPNACGYAKRVAKGNGFACPTGYKDTGRPATSIYQCSIGPCGPTPADPIVDDGGDDGDWGNGGDDGGDDSEPPSPAPRPTPAPKPTPAPAPRPTPAPKPVSCPEFQVMSNGKCICDPNPANGVTWDGKNCVCDYNAGFTWNEKTRKCVKSAAPKPSPSPSGGGCPSGGWKDAWGSVYTSYPAPGSKEWDEYSGGKYLGLFAYINGKKSEDWVKSNNIASVFNSKNGRNDNEMKKNYAGKYIWVRNKKNGNCMKVQIVDTCGDGDCKGCCTRNANKSNSGMLIDLEKYTAKRFYGSGYYENNGEPANFEALEWQFA
ncbi:hypothetical protein ATCV1_Z517R [Acanthocystis turfacea chlorella virus 1]|uniref:Uncharacterized protein Z517R n=1 Tax=Chlorovirus heliozoae TaxID=322019 RepID=A7K9C7_9PHYC|nr:hypothetical protein ATCV1_Z517R [Acanthocystis turfacea chlorella virus 1]ABT16651.1 hypothetical protein ATCV1_Z517R [Acanthocystis turfacea chlorella virus 1]